MGAGAQCLHCLGCAPSTRSSSGAGIVVIVLILLLLLMVILDAFCSFSSGFDGFMVWTGFFEAGSRVLTGLQGICRGVIEGFNDWFRARELAGYRSQSGRF